jgi:hypothetical protein
MAQRQKNTENTATRTVDLDADLAAYKADQALDQQIEEIAAIEGLVNIEVTDVDNGAGKLEAINHEDGTILYLTPDQASKVREAQHRQAHRVALINMAEKENCPEFSPAQLAIAAEVAAKAASLPRQPKEGVFATSPDYCREMVSEAIGCLVAGFTTLENRVVGIHGGTGVERNYPLNAKMPDGVEDTGNVVTVNRYRYIAEQVANAVVWKLERLVDQQNERVAAQETRIRDAVRSYERGRVDEAFLNRTCDILEDIEEQAMLVRTAFEEAKDAFYGATGVVFETNEMRSDRKSAAEAASKELGDTAGVGVSARAAALLARGRNA